MEGVQINGSGMGSFDWQCSGVHACCEATSVVLRAGSIHGGLT